MTQALGSSCCVCGARDARALVAVGLAGGQTATVCGSHALMHRRLSHSAASESELRELLRDRRVRPERRGEGDDLGTLLTAAFSVERRAADRRRA